MTSRHLFTVLAVVLASPLGRDAFAGALTVYKPDSNTDLVKCSAGHREYCSPPVRCWDGVVEIDCDTSAKAYKTLKAFWVKEPPMVIQPNELWECSWYVDFKNSSHGGSEAKPWIVHTNFHAAPADLGVLPPPTNDPLRKDSVTLKGFQGLYSGAMSLPQGTWLILAHIRIQEFNNTAATKYEMTVDLVRQIGNASEVCLDPSFGLRFL